MSVFDIIFICFIGSGLTLTLITIRQRKANKYLKDLSSATKIITDNEYSEIGIAIRAGEYLVKCPDCAEFIKLEANVCKNCHRDVATFTQGKREELAKISELKTLARQSKDAASKSTGIRVAVVIFALLGSYLLFNFVSTALSNNKIENLRECTYQQNSFNRLPSKKTTSGYRNVTKNSNKKWQVGLTLAGQYKYFGSFDDIELADLVAQEARSKYHKQFKFNGVSI